MIRRPAASAGVDDALGLGASQIPDASEVLSGRESA
jgi:hypothetical protein